MSINPKPKFGSKFEYSMTGFGGRYIQASGSPSGENVRIEIHEPATGYGAAEQPERFSEIVVTVEEFETWSSHVLKAIKEGVLT